MLTKSVSPLSTPPFPYNYDTDPPPRRDHHERLRQPLRVQRRLQKLVRKQCVSCTQQEPRFSLCSRRVGAEQFGQVESLRGNTAQPKSRPR